MKRVLCKAVVTPDVDGEEEYEVTVIGAGDHDGVERMYDIKKNTQKDAAMEGIRLFVEEFSK
jgi:hypothetical protein